MRSELTEARRVRTKAANELRRLIAHNITSPAEWNDRGERVGPDYVGLPSWWPFWSDVVHRNTRELVRLARRVAELEGREL